ncbi:MAG: phosphoribosylglycinamide synthetase C domain-containing protein, partial [Acidobacteriota bacterium]
GANTGGMGTITDAGLLTQSQTDEVIEKIIKPTLKGAEQEGFPFRGIMFLGLMMTKEGTKLLEYNVRFGDPETQVILVRLKTDLVEICEAMLSQKLSNIEIEWQKGSSACVVLASKGYPKKAQTGDVISGLDKAKAIENIKIFHAGTSKNADNEYITAGGRVLGVTATAENLDEALQNVYQAVSEINWNGMQFRRDIGK